MQTPDPADPSPWLQPLHAAAQVVTDSPVALMQPGMLTVIGAIVLVPLLLFRQARRQSPDVIGQVKTQAYRGMLRSALVVIGGGIASAVSYGAASGGGVYVVFWGAMLFGGLGLVWQLASYFLRTKPRLDALALVSAVPPARYAAPIPPRPRRGFWGWIRIIAISFIVLSAATRMLYSIVGRPSSISRSGPTTRSSTAAPPRVTVVPLLVPTASGAGPSGGLEDSPPTRTDPTRQPRPTATASTWGYFDDFVDADMGPVSQDGASWSIRNGVMSISIEESESLWWKQARLPSEGRDSRFRADIASTSGEGKVALLLLNSDGEPVWAFKADPLEQTWSVDRLSTERDAFFTWVEPRPYVGSLDAMEIRVEQGVPTLFINGRDVMSPANVRLDSVGGSLFFAFGGEGAGFTVAFDAITIDERAVTLADEPADASIQCVASQWAIAPDWQVLHDLVNPYSCTLP
jgi:hypothetical protein